MPSGASNYLVFGELLKCRMGESNYVSVNSDYPSDFFREESDVGEGFFPTTAMALRATSKRMSRPSSPSSSSDGDASSTSSKPEGSYAGTFTLVKHKRRGGEKKRLGCQPVLAEGPPGICYYCNKCPSLGSALGERLCSGCHSELL